MTGCACGHHHPHGHHHPAPTADEVAVSGRIVCADASELIALLAALPDHIATSRAEAGCHSYEITQTDDPLVWRIEALFADRAATGRWAEATAALHEMG